MSLGNLSVTVVGSVMSESTLVFGPYVESECKIVCSRVGSEVVVCDVGAFPTIYYARGTPGSHPCD